MLSDEIKDVKIQKNLDKKFKKQEEKKSTHIFKLFVIPALIASSFFYGAADQHKVNFKPAMDHALSYYQSHDDVNQYENRIYNESYSEMKEFQEKINYGNIFEENQKISKRSNEILNSLYANELTKFKRNMMTQKESALYYNEQNMDYLKLRLLDRINTRYFMLIIPDEDGGALSNIIKTKIFNETKERISHEESKLTEKNKAYVDYYFESLSRAENELFDSNIQNNKYLLTGLAYNALNDNNDENIYSSKRIMMENRALSYYMQPYLEDLIKKGEELKGFNVKVEEVRGVLPYEKPVSLEEYQHIVSSFKK